ncbi:MAG: hypothetical protein Q8O67_34085 [Deltaproteobacteria bacterium]|nr:hypothetical protein [Deltaproteobacteria bacterium]
MFVALIVLASAAAQINPPARPLDVTVVVPLCDGTKLACGRGVAGDPRSLEGNLYWGAMYGAERFLAKAKGFRVLNRTDAPDPQRPGLLRVVVIERAPIGRERAVRLTLEAWDGAQIDAALAAFFAAARAPSSDLLVWAGHDRIMDVAAPSGLSGATSSKPVAVLACESERYFGPALAAAGARPVALTRTFMAPEAYLLEALASSVARNGVEDRVQLRASLIEAYAKFQRISPKAASSVFSKLE